MPLRALKAFLFIFGSWLTCLGERSSATVQFLKKTCNKRRQKRGQSFFKRAVQNGAVLESSNTDVMTNWFILVHFKATLDSASWTWSCSLVCGSWNSLNLSLSKAAHVVLFLSRLSSEVDLVETAINALEVGVLVPVSVSWPCRCFLKPLWL